MALQRSFQPLTRRTKILALELIVPLVIVGVWWWLSASSTSLYFPPLADIVDELTTSWLFVDWSSDILPSLGNLAIGYVLACVSGVALGTLLGANPTLGNPLMPILEFARAIPGVAILPAAILLLGIGNETRISLIIFGTIWPVLLNTIDGVRSLDPAVKDLARSYRITPTRKLLFIVLPAASPQIVAGMRTALAIGVTVMVFSEMQGTTNGIGFQILDAQHAFAVPRMWAGIIFLGIVGYLLNIAFRSFEYVVLHWHRGMRATSRS